MPYSIASTSLISDQAVSHDDRTISWHTTMRERPPGFVEGNRLNTWWLLEWIKVHRSIDVRRFFKIRNLTRRIERLLPKLTFLLRSELRVLAMPNAPDLPSGPHCTDPIKCEFFDRCNPPLPDDHIDR